MKNKLFLFMAMLVVAIVAVGSVSATEDIVTDIDAQTDDITVEDVSVEEDIENDEILVDENIVTTADYSVTISAGSNSSYINSKIDEVSTNGGGNVYFESGDYSDIAITLKSNVNLIGNGAVFTGTGSSHVITLANNLNGFTISGLTINVNNAAGGYSAIYGSLISNGVIYNNTLYNGANGININKKYYNITVEDNVIYNMNNDGVSLAHPNANSNINDPEYSIISGNNINNCAYGIFIGGNFKGAISNNRISDSTWGIQSAGKANGQISSIIATISGNTISGVQTGIEFINMTAISLNITSNTISTNNFFNNYTINYGDTFSNATNESIRVSNNSLTGSIKQSLINMACVFSNYFDGNIKYNE